MGLGITLGVYLKAISPSGSVLLLLLLHFHGGIIATASAAEQKCDKIVSVETVEILSYLGNVTFTAPTSFKGRWTAVIKFTSPFTFIGGWGVGVESYGQKAYAVFKLKNDETLRKGDKIIFQFRVLYGWNKKVPKVLSIKWENRAVCGPPISVTSISPPTLQEMEGSSSEEGEENADTNHESTDVIDAFQQYITTNNVRFLWKEPAKKD
ncbi:unnamed protein product [Orchesella dallaii]|uniref:Defense protein 3 n=1 Tax=Orchesella dallaii TaxID=48710 RepID=A0ABP1QKR5_9HEXA